MAPEQVSNHSDNQSKRGFSLFDQFENQDFSFHQFENVIFFFPCHFTSLKNSCCFLLFDLLENQDFSYLTRKHGQIFMKSVFYFYFTSLKVCGFFSLLFDVFENQFFFPA